MQKKLTSFISPIVRLSVLILLAMHPMLSRAEVISKTVTIEYGYEATDTESPDESAYNRFIDLGPYGRYGLCISTIFTGGETSSCYGHKSHFLNNGDYRWHILEVAPIDGTLDETKAVVNVVGVAFYLPDYKLISHVRAVSGEPLRYSNSYMYWYGASPSVKFFFPNPNNYKKYYQQVYVYFEIRTGADMVRHPRFEPGTLADFSDSKNVTITADPGDAIYYTRDDEHFLAENGRTTNETYLLRSSTPSSTPGNKYWLSEPWRLYEGPITIDKTTRFRAVAVKNINGVPTPSGVDTCLIIKRPQEIVAYGHEWYNEGNNGNPRTYSWWNPETQTFEQANISDEATNPWQIAALAKEVYINPDYPAMETLTVDDFRGDIHIGLPDDVSRKAIIYTTPHTQATRTGSEKVAAGVINEMFDRIPVDPSRANNGYQYQMADNPNIKPHKQGITALLVKMKEDFNRADFVQRKFKHGNYPGDPTRYTDDTPALISTINEVMESVTVLTDGTRIDDPNKGFGDEDYNPGTLFTTTTSLSRFYVVIKGTPDWHANTAIEHGNVNPFMLFEEVSPAFSGDGRLYASLAAGEVYKAYHNCADIISREGKLGSRYAHEFVVDLEGERQFDNFTIFIPDYRHRRREHNVLHNRWWGHYYPYAPQEYVDRYAPSFGLYAVHLKAKARLSTTQPDPVVTDGKTFHYFTATPSWTTNLDNIIASSPNTEEEFKLYIVNPDGTLQRINQFGQPCDDNDAPANLIDNIETISYDVLQREDSYTITYRVYARVKGWTGETSWARSNDAEVLIPGIHDTEVLMLDIEVPRKGEFNAAQKRNFYTHWVRLLNINEDYPFTATKLNSSGATTMSVYRLEPGQDATQGEGVKFADITIQRGVFNTGDNLYHYNYAVTYYEDTQKPAANVDKSLRTLTGYFTSERTDSEVDFRGLMFVDQFGAVIPEDNSHCETYRYQVVYQHDHEYWSNIASVNIPKTSISATSFLHNLEEVTNDTGRGTDINTRAQATVRALDDVNVVAYRVLDTSDYNSHGITRAVRNGDGSYTPQKQDENGFYHGTHSIPFQTDGLDRMMGVATEDTRTDLVDRGYVPQIRYATRLPDGTIHTSTYGAPENKVSTPKLVFSVSEDIPIMRGDADPMPYATTMVLNTEGLDKAGSQKYLYRVWRVEPDGTETLLNGHQNWGTADSDRQTNYGVLDQTNTSVRVTLTDVAFDKPIEQLGNYKAQRYIARMYSVINVSQGGEPEPLPDNPLPPPMGAPRKSQTKQEFFIDEKEIVVEFTDEVVTGITGVFNHAEVMRVDYISLSGARSDKPFPGMNIVVTHYTNGNTVTTKQRF